jgi:hypothetical protein
MRGDAMRDLAFVLVSIGFFGLSWLYVRFCDRLLESP